MKSTPRQISQLKEPEDTALAIFADFFDRSRIEWDSAEDGAMIALGAFSPENLPLTCVGWVDPDGDVVLRIDISWTVPRARAPEVRRLVKIWNHNSYPFKLIFDEEVRLFSLQHVFPADEFSYIALAGMVQIMLDAAPSIYELCNTENGADCKGFIALAGRPAEGCA